MSKRMFKHSSEIDNVEACTYLNFSCVMRKKTKYRCSNTSVYNVHFTDLWNGTEKEIHRNERIKGNQSVSGLVKGFFLPAHSDVYT